MRRVALSVLVLGFASCRFFPNPARTTMPQDILSPTVDVQGRIFAGVATSTDRELELGQYRFSNGSFVLEKRWVDANILTIEAVDATTRPREVWVLHDTLGGQRLNLVELQADERHTTPVSRVHPNDMASFSEILDIASGRDGRLYVVGLDEDAHGVVAYCDIFHGLCTNFVFASRRADDRGTLSEPSKIDVDLSNGDVYVSDPRYGTMVYTENLRPSRAEIVDRGYIDDITALDGFVVTTRGASFRLYQRDEDANSSGVRELRYLDTYVVPAHVPRQPVFPSQLAAGGRTSPKCGFFYSSQALLNSADFSTILSRHKVGSDCD